ncbi:tryptophan synthase subunit alpha [Actinomycetaceae bacterium MB13-C1-2]|nr:tryptophan synthase subunit alpha [Actinomycetaceae bacterium MB13-C1-2]
MRSREAIQAANNGGRAALLGYLPLGYPSVDKSIEASKVLVDNGVDIIELGFPYSDPGMDGPVIQAATTEALARGTHIEDLFAATQELTDYGACVVSMTYWNPVFWYGVEKFSRDFANAGGSGLITPDLPPDEAGEWTAASDQYGLERIFLSAPSSNEERLKKIGAASNGWVYAASTMGVTGARSAVDSAARGLVSRCRDAGCDPVCVGLGVSNGQQASQIASFADGVIVGSALVRPLLELPWDEALSDIARRSKDLRSGVQKRGVSSC